MELPTIQPREPHIKDDGLRSSKHPDSRAASARSTDSVRPKRGSKDRSTVDEEIRSDTAAQIMRDLGAATGYGSYQAYLESLRFDPMYPGPFWKDFSVSDDPNYKQFCSIVDVSIEEPSLPKATLRCEYLSAIQAAASLREPAKGVSVQIVFCSDIPGFNFDAEFVNVFGLGLNLDPRFFYSLQVVPLTDIKNEEYLKVPGLSKYFEVAGTLVAIARNCPLAKPGTPPIVLIAGSHGLNYQIDTKMLYYMIREVSLPQIPDDQARVRGDFVSGRNASLYVELLSVSMRQNPDCILSSEALLFGSLLPLLQTDISRMRTRCLKIRWWFGRLKRWNDDDTLGEEKTSNRLHNYRTSLRSSLEDFKDVVDHLKDFTSSQLAPELTVSPAYSRIVEERRLLLEDALRLEAEIRDYLQLQAGQLSLLESRKSIEVSNNQLEESKRAKIFTMLAFIYVPLNLATSIYGMNLQQLNGSGKSLGDFIATAAVALIITGGSWWLIEQMSSLRTWRARDPLRYKGPVTTKADGRSSPNYSILVRAAMLAWLVKNGYWLWMVRSGAGWCTLTNSGATYRYNEVPGNHRGFGEGLCASDFLSKYIYPHHLRFLFEPGRGSWKGSRDG